MPSFRTEKFIFAHMNKTAGMWFYYLCRERIHLEIIEQAPYLETHKPATYFENWMELPWIAIYRNPLDWYASLYNYHVKTNWKWTPLRKGMTYHSFVDFQLDQGPMTWIWDSLVTGPRRWLIEHDPENEQRLPPLYLIEYENMHSELEMVMNRIIGYHQFNKEFMKTIGKRNARDQRTFRWNIRVNQVPALTPRLRDKIKERDKPIMDYYTPEFRKAKHESWKRAAEAARHN